MVEAAGSRRSFPPKLGPPGLALVDEEFELSIEVF
jgi:hypothetical protein